MASNPLSPEEIDGSETIAQMLRRIFRLRSRHDRPKSPPKVFDNVKVHDPRKPLHPRKFLGRSTLLNEIQEFFSHNPNDQPESAGQSRNLRLCALTGLGGIGGTEVALQFVEKFGDFYSNIVWIDSKNDTSIKESFVSLVKVLMGDKYPHLKIKIDDLAPNRIVQTMQFVYKCLISPGKINLLIIFDGAECLNDESLHEDCKTNSSIGILKYLNMDGESRPSVLVTSNYGNWNIDTRIEFKVIPLRVLKTQCSRQFYEVAFGPNIGNDPNVKDLDDILEGFPMAMQQTRKIIPAETPTIKEFDAFYNRNKRRFLETEIETEFGRSKSTFGTWERIVNKIREGTDGSLAFQLLYHIACVGLIKFELVDICRYFTPKGISGFKNLDEIAADKKKKDGLLLLQRFSIVSGLDPEQEERSIRILRLMMDFVISRRSPKVRSIDFRQQF